MTTQQHNIIISAIEGVSAQGTQISDILDHVWSESKTPTQSECKLDQFKAAPLLTDRRMLKAVSRRDSFGLAAIENLKKVVSLSEYDTYRVGMYVGAPPSSTDDHQNYLQAVRQSKSADGSYHEAEFGAQCMQSRPTTLLLGLPNNVLCYGSIIMDARGPNNNYTSAETSAHVAVQAAARNIKMGRIDGAVAGGYTEHTDQVRFEMHKAHGWIAPEGSSSAERKGAVLADGALFATIERSLDATKRGVAAVRAVSIASPGQGSSTATLTLSDRQEAVTRCLTEALNSSGLSKDAIATVFVSGSGYSNIDDAEIKAVHSMFPDKNDAVIATTGTHTGQLMEAGGLLEVAVFRRITEESRVPSHLRVNHDAVEKREFNRERRSAIILRSSFWGEVSCLVIEV